MNDGQTSGLLTRGAVDVVSEAELRNKLNSGKKLRVKLGADPTSADLHLGHSVVLNKLRAFQDLGHTAVLVIGDFTASVGDPSGRNCARPVLSRKEIAENAKTYTQQAFKILDPDKTEIRFNGQWLNPFVSNGGLLSALSKLTVSRSLERDDFKKRLKEGSPISLLEIMYSLFQGQDSVALNADVELGGADQIFNLLAGRQMQKNNAQEPQVVITVPLLLGTDGVKKMSKSYGNYVAFNDSPQDMYGKIMSISDKLMFDYYELLTFEDLNVVKAKHPMQAKKDLARIITTRFHGTEAASRAKEGFEKVFAKKENPHEMPTFGFKDGESLSAVIVNCGFAKSKNEARRLIEQGGVSLDGAKASRDASLEKDEATLRVGKIRFCKLRKEL